MFRKLNPSISDWIVRKRGIFGMVDPPLFYTCSLLGHKLRHMVEKAAAQAGHIPFWISKLSVCV